VLKNLFAWHNVVFIENDQNDSRQT